MIPVFWVGCGIKKTDEKKKLNDNTITLTPVSGYYQFKPWVKLTRKSYGTGTEVF